METTKLSSKGQIIIPKWLRDIYRWETGLEFVVIDTGEGVLLKPNRPFAPSTLEDVAGSLSYGGEAKTLEEMEDGLRLGVRETWDDSR